MFGSDFFQEILGRNPETDKQGIDDIITAGKEIKTPGSDKVTGKNVMPSFDILDRRYDKKYYGQLNKNEQRLHEGKKIDTTDLASERFVKDNNLGVKTPDGWSGLMTKNQLKKAGFSIKDKSISTRDIPSTAIGRVRYNPETQNLYITFRNGNGKEYLFPNVPEEKVRKLLNAGSKGRYYGKYVKPHYAVSKAEALAIKARDKDN